MSLRWRSLRFWSWTWLNSSALRIATPISLANRSSSVWSARSQVWVAGRLARSRPIRSSPARRSARIGTRHAGDPLLGLDAVRIDEPDRRGDEAEGTFGVTRRAFGHELDAVSRLGGLDRRQDEPELLVPSLRVARQPVVALGKPRQHVVALDRERLAAVARRHPVTASEISSSGAHEVAARPRRRPAPRPPRRSRS